MKKICLFLFITCILSVNSMDARTVMEIPSVPVETSVNADQYDLEIIAKALEELGFEVEKLEVQDPEEEKECRLTLKGTYDNKEVNLTIVIKGQTCAEFFREVMKK